MTIADRLDPAQAAALSALRDQLPDVAPDRHQELVAEIRGELDTDRGRAIEQARSDRSRARRTSTVRKKR